MYTEILRPAFPELTSGQVREIIIAFSRWYEPRHMDQETLSDMLIGFAAGWLQRGVEQHKSHAALLEACKAVVAECEATFVDTSDMAPAWIELEKELRAAIAMAERKGDAT